MFFHLFPSNGAAFPAHRRLAGWLLSAIMAVASPAMASGPAATCGLEALPLPAADVNGKREVKRGELTLRLIDDLDADATQWEGKVEAQWRNGPTCHFKIDVGTAGATAYYSPAHGILLFAGVVSVNEGEQLRFIDAHTCRSVGQAETPFLATQMLEANCLRNREVHPTTIEWPASGEGVEARQCAREQTWILDLNAACRPRWRVGHRPPPPGE